MTKMLLGGGFPQQCRMLSLLSRYLNFCGLVGKKYVLVLMTSACQPGASAGLLAGADPSAGSSPVGAAPLRASQMAQAGLFLAAAAPWGCGDGGDAEPLWASAGRGRLSVESLALCPPCLVPLHGAARGTFQARGGRRGLGRASTKEPHVSGFLYTLKCHL